MQRKFLRDFLICLIPLALAAYVVTNAYLKSSRDERGGFKLGIDLSGGTILVYEVDQGRTVVDTPGIDDDGRADLDMAEMATSLKRRLDPNNLRDITIRPVGEQRIEIIQPSTREEEIRQTKDLIGRVGRLRFTIVANPNDDSDAIDAVQEYYRTADAELEQLLQERAEAGLPPPVPDGDFAALGEAADYDWVELGRSMRDEMGLSNRFERTAEPGTAWRRVADARERGEPVLLDRTLIFSRNFVKSVPRPDELPDGEDRVGKQYEYFALVRGSDSVEVGGNISLTAYPDQKQMKPVIGFRFNSTGANAFGALTTKNRPDEAAGVFRQLAVVLDGMIETAPRLNDVIRDAGIIEGNFSNEEVKQRVQILRAGALPATLKPLPVSENTIGPTLGADTIRAGAFALAGSFIVILAFMMVYYRFAGLVATTALTANLLLTVAFMLLVDATFTLPGLAGLALTMGMAVDSNILIYERIREERDRGATLVVAIRNGYDRAFSTIIDTHLSSIFTAVVLYVVGNDQLKGFGVSLGAGLTISLFTTLFMTRLIFDFSVSRRIVTRLGMFRFFSRPNINFMGVRHYFFAASVTLTLLGLALFLARGVKGLNVDFVGGTAYGGKLLEPTGIEDLRDKLKDTWQDQQLSLPPENAVEQVPDPSGRFPNTYRISFADGESSTVSLANDPDGDTTEERLADVRERVSRLRDASVEQVFLSDQQGFGGKSRYFTIRTTEREPELVQTMINRLFRQGDEARESMLAKSLMNFRREGSGWILEFTDADRATTEGDEGHLVYTSPSYVRTLLDRRFIAKLGDQGGSREPYTLRGIGEERDGRFARMLLTTQTVPAAASRAEQGVGSALGSAAGPLAMVAADMRDEGDLSGDILAQVRETFNSLPQPERLETFDGALASETRARALYAIMASWMAVLLYLWFRFGNWTFGLAAVLCLIHDLGLTLGVIACCHYLYDTAFGQFLGLQDFKIDLATVAALLTLVGYSVNDTIVVFDRIREVRGKSPELTPKTINDSINQTLSRTLLASLTTFLVVSVLYVFGGEGVKLFAFVMVIGVIVGTYSSIYIASPLLLMFGEGKHPSGKPIGEPEPEEAAV